MKHVLLLAAISATITVHAQMGFTPNEGQFADQEGNPANTVLFKACGAGPGIFVTTEGLTYVFTQKREAENREEGVSSTDWSAIRMQLVNADIRKENVTMEDELAGVSNYYFAHCPQGILNVKSYHRITIKNIYPGIDWVLTADDVNGIAHDFVVHPNGNHQMIRMQYNGLTSPITYNDKNQLTLTSSFGTMYEGGLKVFRSDNNKPLLAYFNITGYEVSFFVARHGKCGLVIDPPLQWNSLQASTGMDYAYGVAAAKDGTGDVLGCGHTDGTDFPVMNAQQGTLSAQEDAVIYRLDPLGNRLWSTYFGGTDLDNAKGIATDAAGNAYITGHTNSQDLPVMNSLQANFGGGVYDAFIAKYNSAGVMQWASWRGGIGSDFGTGIDADANGNIYVVGYTGSTNFPTLNPIQAAKSAVNDGFVFAANSSQVMQWSTFFGGNDEDKFRGVSLDATASNIVIAGNSMSSGLGTAGAFQQFNAMSFFTSDGLIVKMSVGQVMSFVSYCGGDDEDFAQGATFDAAGNIYVTGYTTSFDFPKVDQGGQSWSDTSLNAIGVQDPFIVKCNSSGSTLLWATFFGGTMTDYAFDIQYDLNYGIYVCGNTASTDFPVMQPADLQYYQSVHGDGGNFNDMWIAWFDINDSLRWSTYYGNSMSNEAYSIDCGMTNDIYVAGVDSNEIAMLKFNPGLPTNTLQVCGFGQYGPFPFPNPATDIVSLSFWTSEGTAIIEISDVAGRVVKQSIVNTTEGENILRMDVSEFAAGNYHLSIRSEVATRVYQFVKE